MRFPLALFCLMLLVQSSLGQDRYKGTMILCGTGSLDDSIALVSFRNLVGPNGKMVFIPTASSGIKLPNNYIFIPPAGDTTAAYIEAFEIELAAIFKIKNLKVLHTRSRNVASEESFLLALREADGVWISGGNAGRLADTFLKTKVQAEIENVLKRGGVVAGNSAGAIILGSYIVRGWTEKPMLMAKGHDVGFGFLKKVAINPHLITAKRENELISVVDAFPDILGIGIDDYTSLIIKNNQFEIVGKSRVAIYDNQKHGERWYYWLSPGTRFDLISRTVLK